MFVERRRQLTGACQAATENRSPRASAALFGLSTPAAKVLVGSVQPAILAGLLYCGAGVGIAILRRLAPSIVSRAPEVALTRAELLWLGGAIAAGGVVGPIFLMAGLTRTDAAAASLLLTFEGAATALIAWFIFHENVDRRVALGMVCLVVGVAVLFWSGAPRFDSLVGPLAIVGACTSTLRIGANFGPKRTTCHR